MEDVGGVDFGEEARGGGGVAGEDGVGVVRAVPLDVVERVVEGVDDADGEDEVGVLGVPFVVGDEVDGGVGQEGAGAGIAADLYGFFFEGANERRQYGGRDAAWTSTVSTALQTAGYWVLLSTTMG